MPSSISSTYSCTSQSSLSDDVVELPEPLSEGYLQEIENLQTLIQHKQVAALARYRPINPMEVAAMCFQWVEAHPGEVEVLFWNDDVAAEAIQLLRTITHRDHGSEAVAHCLLRAGRDLDTKDIYWPGWMRDLLRPRWQAFQDYWQSKRKKFTENPPSEELKVFRERYPFFSRSDAKSTHCLNEALGTPGKEFVCRHLAEAIDDDPKGFLKRISQRDVESLMYGELEQRHFASIRKHRHSAVHFTPDEFGRLLVRVASLVQPGEIRSFCVFFTYLDQTSIGHVMKIFLKKQPSKSDDSTSNGPMSLKVAMYDPNVSGDMKHLRVLPEHLERLSFHDFDALGFVLPHVPVLSLAVGDDALARALAGQFVQGGTHVRVSNLIHSLLFGTVHEMRPALLALQVSDLADLRVRLPQLRRTMSFVLLQNHDDAISELARSPLLPLFGDDLVKTLLMGNHELGKSALHLALQFGRPMCITALAQLLAAVESQLSAGFIEEFLLARSNDHCGLLAAVQHRQFASIRAFGDLLEPVSHRLSSEALRNVLEAKSTQGRSAWSMAMEPGRAKGFEALFQLLAQVENQLEDTHLQELLQIRCGGKSVLRVAVENRQADVVRALGDVLGRRARRLSDKTLWNLFTTIGQNQMSLLCAVVAGSEGDTPDAMWPALAHLLAQVQARLHESHIRELLMPEHHAEPGLWLALAQGRVGAIRGLDGVLQQICHRLGTDALQDVFAARHEGKPGLTAALCGGHDHAVTAFGELLHGFREWLPVDAMKDIFLATDGTGLSALNHALAGNNAACVRAFGSVLLASDLSSRTLSTVLAAQNLTYPLRSGLRFAIQQQHVEAIQAYAELVLELQRSPSRLSGRWGSHLLQHIRGAQGTRQWYWGFTWHNTAQYTNLMKQNPHLYGVFKRAKHALKT